MNLRHALIVLTATLLLAGVVSPLPAADPVERIAAELGAEIADATVCLAAAGDSVLAVQRHGLGLLSNGRLSLLATEMAANGRAGTDVQLNRGDRLVAMGRTSLLGQDLDIRVYDPNGAQVAQDLATDNTPIVDFQAGIPGKYRVELHLCRTVGPGIRPFCALALLEPNGVQVAQQQYTDLVRNLMATNAVYAGRLLAAKGRVLRLQGDPNCWAFLGAALTADQRFRYRAVVHRQCERLIMGAGDDFALDVDLFLRTQNGETLRDIAKDAEPILEFTVNKPVTYDVELAVPLRRGGATLVMVHEAGLE